MDAVATLALPAFLGGVSRGVTGAASAVTFNATYLAMVAAGLGGGVPLLDALLCIAFLDAVAGWVMAIRLRAELRFDRLTRQLLLATLTLSLLLSVFLPTLDAPVLQVLLGLGAIAVSIPMATAPGRAELSADEARALALPTGVVAGVLSGLFGMAGPPIFWLVSRVHADPAAFRARMATLSLAIGSARLLVLLSVGAYGGRDLFSYAAILPVLLVGLAVGHRIHPHVAPNTFRMVIAALVALAGVAGLATAF